LQVGVDNLGCEEKFPSFRQVTHGIYKGYRLRNLKTFLNATVTRLLQLKAVLTVTRGNRDS